MKKILVLNYEFPPIGGGGSPVSYDMANYLANSGEFSVDVVTSKYQKLPEYEEVNKNFRIYRVEAFRRKKEIGYPWEQLAYLVSAFFKVMTLVRSNKYDFCHTHFIVPTGALAYIVKLFWKIPYIITSHGSDIIGYNKRLDLRIVASLIKIPWRMIIHSSTKITVPSNYLKQKLISVYPGIDKSKIELIYNVIEQGRFKSSKHKVKQILLISRLHEHKGVQDFIEAIREVDLKEWKVIVAGDGPQRSELESMVAEYGLVNSVEFVGWQNFEEKSKLYADSQIFVNPSHKESFGMTTIEALMSGCTAVLSNTGIASDLDNVYIFEPKDILGLRNMLLLAIKKHIVSKSYEMFYTTKVMDKFIELIKNND